MTYKLKKVWVDHHFYSNVVTATYQIWSRGFFLDFQIEEFLEYLPKDGEYSREEIAPLNLPKWVKSAISK